MGNEAARFARYCKTRRFIPQFSPSDHVILNEVPRQRDEVKDLMEMADTMQ